MYLFKDLGRQTRDSINIINVVPVSFVFNLKQLSTLALVLAVALWNLLLSSKTLNQYCTATEIEVSSFLFLDFLTGVRSRL